MKEVEPTSAAKYVHFVSLLDPKQMPGQNSPFYTWPYSEGLRLDEAMHDLTLLTTGLYGKDLLPQNGAPLRVVVPWKYGFKSAKAIVKIELVADQPRTLWSDACAQRIRLLLQRQSRRAASALVAGQRTPHRRGGPPAHVAVQRLCRSGGVVVYRHGLARELLDS